MKELIKQNLKYLAQLTKAEADFVSHILEWDDEQRMAFKFAKKIFDDEIESDDDESETG